MVSWPFTFFCLLIGAAGWYYLFYSKAAHRLGTIEKTAANARRVRLRRANGAAMIMLGALLYIGMRGVDATSRPSLFVVLWIGVMLLLLVIVLLALIDIRLTSRLRAEHRQNFK